MSKMKAYFYSLGTCLLLTVVMILFTRSSILAQSCPIPNLSNPNPIGPTVVTPQWYANPGQVFDLQYRRSSDSDWETISDIGISSYTGYYNITELEPGTTYDWRVRRVCGVDSKSDFSGIRNFQTMSCLPPTTIQVLSANLGTSAANLGWSNDNQGSLEYATTMYNYRWRSSGGDWQHGNSVFKSCVIDGLTANTGYEIQVQTACGAGQLSRFSDSYTFTTQRCPDYIIHSVPRRGITSARLLISFEFSGPGSYSFDTYLVQWRPQGSTDAWQQKLHTGGYLYTLLGLSPSSNYEFQISVGCGGSSTEPSVFGTSACTNEVGSLDSAPSVSTSPGLVQFRWSGGYRGYTDLTVFVLRYREVGHSTWTTLKDINAIDVSPYSPYSLYDLKSSTAYEWQIATRCGPETLSDFTESGIFTTAAEPSGDLNYTLNSGAWSTASLWSLGRVPNRQDIVELRHPILIPVSYTAVGGTLKLSRLGRFFCDPQGNARWAVGSP